MSRKGSEPLKRARNEQNALRMIAHTPPPPSRGALAELHRPCIIRYINPTQERQHHHVEKNSCKPSHSSSFVCITPTMLLVHCNQTTRQPFGAQSHGTSGAEHNNRGKDSYSQGSFHNGWCLGTHIGKARQD